MIEKPHTVDDKLGIVFIHGAGLGGWIWNEVSENLSSPYVCANYDSLERTSSQATLVNYANAVHQQLEELNVNGVVVVAHSVGGVVGLELCSKLGDKLAGFIGVSAAIPKPGNNFVSSLPFPQKIIMPLILKLAGTKPPESAIRSGLGNGLPSSKVDEIVRSFQKESEHLYTDRISKTASISVPTLYIRTTSDNEFPLAVQDSFIKHLSNVSVFNIASGHMPMLSEPEVVSAKINSFLAGIQ